MLPEKPSDVKVTGVSHSERQPGHPQPPCNPPATALGPSASPVQQLSPVLYSWIIYASVLMPKLLATLEFEPFPAYQLPGTQRQPREESPWAAAFVQLFIHSWTHTLRTMLGLSQSQYIFVERMSDTKMLGKSQPFTLRTAHVLLIGYGSVAAPKAAASHPLSFGFRLLLCSPL